MGGGLSAAEMGGLLAGMGLPQLAAAARAGGADGRAMEGLGAARDRLGLGFSAHRLKLAARLRRAALDGPGGVGGGGPIPAQ